MQCWCVTESRIFNSAEHVHTRCAPYFFLQTVTPFEFSAPDMFWYVYMSGFLSLMSLSAAPIEPKIIKYLRGLSWMRLLWKDDSDGSYLRKRFCLVGKSFFASFSKRYKMKLSLASPWYELWPRILCLWKQHFLWHSTVWFSAVTLAIASITGN